jgi:hypothetical protein
MESRENRDVLAFWKEFRKIASTESLPGRPKGARICRFCGKPEGTVSFRNKAHAVSDLLGRNDFLIFDECDNCNSLFSTWETQMSQFFMPYLATLGIKGKKEIPAFQSRLENKSLKTRTTMKKDRSGQLNIRMNSLNDLEINSADKTVTITYRQPALSKFFVFKALSKIALSLLPPEEVSENRHIFEWLLDHQNSALPSIPGAYITVLKKIMWQKPVAELFKSTKDFSNERDAFPKYTLVLRFANLVVQIFLLPSKMPSLEGELNHNLNLHYFPGFVLDHAFDPILKNVADPTTVVKMPFSFSFEDLSNEELEERDEVINLKYQSEE